jgi:WD40 repeat protein
VVSGRPDPPMPSALVGTLRGHSHTVTSLALSTDGRYLYSGGDNAIYRWDVGRVVSAGR